MPIQTLAVVTATRAEYGLLRPLLLKLTAAGRPRLQLLVTGAHLSAAHGNTVAEIEADGLPITARLPILKEGEVDEPVAVTIARTITVFDGYFAAHRPDALLVLGDRFEIFAVAVAAASRQIPVAHISGGDVTLGAADEYYRHCITKMAALHFASCAESAARLVRMGEEPSRVFCVGGLGDENIRTLPKMSRAELAASTGFAALAERRFGVVTLHPETAGASPEQAKTAALALTEALDALLEVFWLCTGSNADAGGAACTAVLREYAAKHPDRAGFIQSLGLKRYLSALQYAAVVVGNSSSGVVETPTFGVPTVNIGSRQAGRPICENVLCCGALAAEITDTLRTALSSDFAATAKTARSPYCGGDTSGRMLALMQAFDFTAVKRFYDGPVPVFDVREGLFPTEGVQEV